MKTTDHEHFPLSLVITGLLLLFVFVIANTTLRSVNVTKSLQSENQLAAATPVVTLSLSPSTQSVPVNGTFTVNIVLNTGGNDVYGVDINSLHFNKDVLEVVDANSAMSGIQILPGSILPTNLGNLANNTVGTIYFSQVLGLTTDANGNTVPTAPYKGSGNLASITFRVKSIGAATVTMDFISSGSGTDCNVAGSSGDILDAVSGGLYTGIAAVDNIPPTISNTIISSITTTATTISWSTLDEDATGQVEYGTSNVYDHSTTLVSTLAKTHTATLSGLTGGTLYHYRIKSADAKGNVAVTSDNTFTTQATPDTTAPTVPTGLTATALDNKSIQLSWNPSTDSATAGQSSSGIKHYQVFRDESATALVTTASTAYLDSSLLPNHTYSYQVLAVDNSLNPSAKSTSISAKTTNTSATIKRRIIISLEGIPASKRGDIDGVIEFLDPSTKVALNPPKANIRTDSSGNYVMNIPGGLPAVVAFRIVITGYIPKLLSSVDLSDTSLLDVHLPTLPAGDLNGDRLINSIDFSYMNSKWRTSDVTADVNKDGVVNSIDFSFLSKNWLVVGE